MQAGPKHRPSPVILTAGVFMKKSEDLIFVPLNGKVVGLDRDSGEIQWHWQAPHGREYMTLLPDRDLAWQDIP
jgi:hypothetical protein